MRLSAFTYLGIAATVALLATTVYEDEEMRAHAPGFTDRIAQVQRDATQDLVLTSELPGVLTGRAEVIDGRILRYMASGLTVELAGIDVCSAGQTATFDGTPWPCDVMATAWLISQTLGHDLQYQRFDRRSNGTIAVFFERELQQLNAIKSRLNLTSRSEVLRLLLAKTDANSLAPDDTAVIRQDAA